VASYLVNGRTQEEERFLPPSHGQVLCPPPEWVLPPEALGPPENSPPGRKRKVCIDLTLSSPSSRPSAEKRKKKIENFVDDILELAHKRGDIKSKENSDSVYMGKDKNSEKMGNAVSQRFDCLKSATRLYSESSSYSEEKLPCSDGPDGPRMRRRRKKKRRQVYPKSIYEAPCAPSEWQIGKHLVEGGYAHVYVIHNHKTGVDMAVKTGKMDQEEDRIELKHELLISKLIGRHRNVQTFDYFFRSPPDQRMQKNKITAAAGGGESSSACSSSTRHKTSSSVPSPSSSNSSTDSDKSHLNELWMVSELMDGDCYQLMTSKKYYHKNLYYCDRKEELASKITKSILRAVMHFHKRGVLHLDIKPQNVLFKALPDSDDYIFRLCDFNLSRRWSGPKQKYDEVVFTLGYRAPEILLAEKTRGKIQYDHLAENYGIGATCFQLISNYCMFERYLRSPPKVSTHADFMEIVMKSSFAEYMGKHEKRFSAEAYDFVLNLTMFNREDRMSLEDAMEHPFITRDRHVTDAEMMRTRNKYHKEFEQREHKLKNYMHYFTPK